MDRKTNLRQMVPSMSDGKDVKDTKVLSGEASQDSIKGSNVLKEHTVGAPPKDGLGGHNMRK